MKTGAAVAIAFVLLAGEARADDAKPVTPRPASATAAKATAASAAATAAAATSPGHDALADARARMKDLYDGVWQIERLQAGANGSAVRASCVADKLAQAKVHVRLGADEIALVGRASRARQDAGDGERETHAEAQAETDVRYALTRLELLARRTAEVERAARVCIEDDRSAVDITRVEVQIGPTPGEADTSSGGAAPLTGPR